MENKTIATFDLSTKEGAKRLFNAQNAGGISLKSLANGSEIEVEAVAIYNEVTEEFGQPQNVRVTALFGTDGIVYSSISNSVADGAEKLIPLFELFDNEPQTVVVQRQKSKADRDFITLMIK